MSEFLTKPPQRPHHWMNADGTCHAGELFEAGAPAMPLYTFEQMEAWVRAERAALTTQRETKERE